jgi:hypothetical protein
MEVLNRGGPARPSDGSLGPLESFFSKGVECRVDCRLSGKTGARIESCEDEHFRRVRVEEVSKVRIVAASLAFAGVADCSCFEGWKDATVEEGDGGGEDDGAAERELVEGAEGEGGSVFAERRSGRTGESDADAPSVELLKLCGRDLLALERGKGKEGQTWCEPKHSQVEHAYLRQRECSQLGQSAQHRFDNLRLLLPKQL